MRIVHVANFYGPRSGGLRTAVDRLTAEYAARGHAVGLVVPGARSSGVPARLVPGTVTRVELRSPRLPGTGGYRVIDPWRVRRVLAQLDAQRIEVSDRLTLRGLGGWAAERGLASVMISHERLDRLLAEFLLPAPWAVRLADAANRRSAARYGTVVCTTGFAAEEFERIGTANLARVPLGVDLDLFTPARHDPRLRARLAPDGGLLLVHCGRLSREKAPERSIDTLRVLLERGVPARLVVAGDGPLRRRLERRAGRLPVTFLGFLADRTRLADLLATADVALAPGPHETFGLAALEALASGTPVVVSGSSALPEVLGPDPATGRAVDDDATAFADAVLALDALPAGVRRAACRARAATLPWPDAAEAMLALECGTAEPVVLRRR